jgi:hypothetical protein
MALGSVLVDRARLVQLQAASPTKVEGSTQFVTVTPGAWFKARLFLPGAEQNESPTTEAKGRTRVINSAQLLFATKDLEGVLLDVRFDAKVEVQSAQFGTATYRVMNDPEKIRKKRSVIGHLANVEKAVERQFEPI